MKLGQLLFIPALLGTLILCNPAQAMAGDSGLYLGGSIGQATLEDEFTGDDFKDEDTAFRAFMGLRTSLFPVLDFALETGYRDLGDQSDTVARQNIDVSLKGFDLAGLVIFPLGPVDFFLKAGGMSYTLDTSLSGPDGDDRGIDVLYGAGIGARFWKLGVRAEYELVNVDELDKASMYWLSAYFRF
ncbi:MAG: porin family protein [Desulfobacterota bacterium]|nr:porin family protein [Thermodesulfobacteriota bacterium]